MGARNASGEYDPKVHGTKGPSQLAMPWKLSDFNDNMLISVTKTSSEFPFVLDMNSGNPLGLGYTQTMNGGGQRSSASAAYLTPAVRKSPTSLS